MGDRHALDVRAQASTAPLAAGILIALLAAAATLLAVGGVAQLRHGAQPDARVT